MGLSHQTTGKSMSSEGDLAHGTSGLDALHALRRLALRHALSVPTSKATLCTLLHTERLLASASRGASILNSKGVDVCCGKW